jgi:hypothetical protein
MEFRMQFRDLLLPILAASPALSSRSLESATIACAEWNARCSFSILSLIPCKAASAAAWYAVPPNHVTCHDSNHPPLIIFKQISWCVVEGKVKSAKGVVLLHKISLP